MSLYENVQAARKRPETSRVGMRYSEQDDIQMMQQASEGIPINAIAKSQKRTLKAIKHRIATLAVGIMIHRDISMEETSRLFNIDMVTLSRAYADDIEHTRCMTKLIRDSCM